MVGGHSDVLFPAKPSLAGRVGMDDVAQGVEGASSPEFLAYRVLYQTVHAREGETSSLLAALRLITSEVAPATALAPI